MPKEHSDTFAVVGGGIAGVLAAKLLSKRGFRVELFEKHSSLGGCAGSFTRNGLVFNVGATTVPGLFPNYPVRDFLEEFNALHGVEILEPSMVVHTERGFIRRYGDLERTIEEIEKIFPHRKNREFWSLVYKVTSEILKGDYYHNFNSPLGIVKSLLSMKRQIIKYHRLYMTPAIKGINYYFGQISREYLKFMNGHVKIVAQCSLEEVNMITLMLSLGYPFTGVGYAKEGMGSLLNFISKDINCHFKNEISSIRKNSEGYILRGNNFEEIFKGVILAMPIFENLKIIENREMQKYLNRFNKLQSDNSAVVLYGVLEGLDQRELFHLCLLEKPLPYTTSPYLFFSFSAPQKEKRLTFTASTHTTTEIWKNLRREEYENRKTLLKEKILESLSKIFSIDKTSIKEAFLATPESFYRYLNRRSVGGIPVKRENSLWRIPSNFTPFRGFYLAGDSFFCYQGWLGISLGIKNLIGNLNEKI